MKTGLLRQSSPVQKSRRHCRKKFMYYFPRGFNDQKYIDWERNYKWEAHVLWQEQLNKDEYERLLAKKKYTDIALRAVRIETKTNLLFSFEKMALRDAVKSPLGAREFAKGLYDYVYGTKSLQERFEMFSEVLGSLPRRQTRVLTWPLQTVFGFLADPKRFIFLKPRVTKIAAEKYKFDFYYQSKPNWQTYKNCIDFADLVGKDNADLKPRDYIDLQSFIWVQGSEEYPE
jgi:hypothetical protein